MKTDLEVPAVLVIDDDRAVDDVVCRTLQLGGVSVEAVSNGFTAIEKLKERDYSALVLDPMIRHGLNGYAVLDYIEVEQPQALDRVFLLTGMSEQTIRRTAPSVLPRLFRKPSEASRCAAAVLACSGSSTGRAWRRRSRSILVVEDDYVTAELTLRLLQELGFPAVAAHTGRDALRRITESTYSAVLLDLVLPDIDGFAVLDHLAITRPLLLSRVIVTTGMPEKYMSSIESHRLCGIVRKPIDGRELADLLNRCVARQCTAFEGAGEMPQASS